MSKILEEKTFYFMGGLPRSGSTLLTAILNQHPKVYASPLSPLIDMYLTLRTSIYYSESYQTGLLQEANEGVLKSIGNLFYSDIKKPIIIDKNRGWVTPGNDVVANSLSSKPKTIITMRPILEVLSSFVKLAESNPNNFIDNSIASQDFFVKHYRDINDVRCDYLMQANGEIDQTLLAIANLIKKPESYHIVWYDDLITKPQESLSKIYKFLEIDDFEHDFNNIKSLDKHEDEMILGIKNMHTIESSIKVNKTNPELVLSNYVLKKYSTILDFLPE
jgi:sulfotransferase